MPVIWPDWWEWELEFTPHLEKRMMERNFNEIDLRTMMEKAREYGPDVVEGRWIIKTKLRRRRWEVIVEPDLQATLLVVVTAYPVYGD